MLPKPLSGTGTGSASAQAERLAANTGTAPSDGSRGDTMSLRSITSSTSERSCCPDAARSRWNCARLYRRHAARPAVVFKKSALTATETFPVLALTPTSIAPVRTRLRNAASTRSQLSELGTPSKSECTYVLGYTPGILAGANGLLRRRCRCSRCSAAEEL